MAVKIRVRTLDVKTKRADVFAYDHQLKRWVDVASVYCDKVVHETDTGMMYLVLGGRISALWAPGEYESIEYVDDNGHDWSE